MSISDIRNYIFISTN